MNMEMKLLLNCLLVILLFSCSLNPVIDELNTQGECLREELVVEPVPRWECVEYAVLEKGLPTIQETANQDLLSLPIPKNPIVVAVYPNSFTDQTGQRKSNSEFALFSSAITQAPGHLLIRALKQAADGKFFRVAERQGLDNLTKERQLIRSAREKDNAQPLMPLLFAGVIFEGAVIGYDTNIKTGGLGARYLGIGASKQYRIDNIVISLRMVSVVTGEVLIEVLVTKSIYSYGQSQDVFKFIEAGTELVELEGGNTENEGVTLALQRAVETAVVEIVQKGYDKGFWILQDAAEAVE